MEFHVYRSGSDQLNLIRSGSDPIYIYI
jgi:hypothetical protein